MVNIRESRWIINPKEFPSANIRLFCFPFSGGGASAYVKWSNQLEHFGIELCAIQLPGRENRLDERSETDLLVVARKLSFVISEFINKPFAFMGHSMGATLAFETCRFIMKTSGIEPLHLIVTGRDAPQVAGKTGLSSIVLDSEFLREIAARYGEIPSVILEDVDLKKLYLRVFRSDFYMIDNYHYVPDAALTCPITVFYGDADQRVSRSGLTAWGDLTSGQFNMEMMSGGHFFINTCTTAFINKIGHLCTAGQIGT